MSRLPDGGCCDCGDESAWARSGFCKRHGRLSTSAELLAAVPDPIFAAARVIYQVILSTLDQTRAAAESGLRVSDANGHAGAVHLRRDRLNRLAWAIEWLTTTCASFNGLCCLATSALCAPADTLKRATDASAMADHTLRSAVTSQAIVSALVIARQVECAPVGLGESAAAAAAAEERADAVATSGGARSTVMDRLLLCDVHLRELFDGSGMRADSMHAPSLSIALQALYLRLLTNLEFKRAFAAAYATNYVALANAFMRTHHDDMLLFASQISVQFFNRPQIVMPLVTLPGDEGLLSQMLGLLGECLRRIVRRTSDTEDDTGHLLLSRKRYQPVISDMRFVLAITTVPTHMLSRGSLMRKWGELLLHLEGFDRQHRQVRRPADQCRTRQPAHSRSLRSTHACECAGAARGMHYLTGDLAGDLPATCVGTLACMPADARRRSDGRWANTWSMSTRNGWPVST